MLLPAALLIGACSDTRQPVRLAVADQGLQTSRLSGHVRLASASGNFLAGAHAQRTRDYSAAADYLSWVLRTDTTNKRLRQRAFLAMLASGRMNDTLELARGFFEGDSTWPLAGLILAVDDAKAGKFAAVEKRLNSLPRRGANAYLLPMLLAWSIAAQDRRDEALDALAPLAKNSDLASLHDLHVGLINDLTGNVRVAEQAFIRAAGSRAPLRIVQALGSLYERSNRSAKAREVYRKYIGAHPETRVLDRALERIKSGVRAERLVRDHQHGMAEVFFNMAGTVTQGRPVELGLMYGRLALYLRPDFPAAQLLVARILETLGRNAEAITVYDSVNPQSPFFWNARLRKASTLESAGRTEKAIELLNSMAEEDQRRTDVVITLADLLRAKKRYERSVEMYTRAIDRAGELKKRHWSLLYARGISLERTKLWDQAEKDFLRALKLNPDQPYVLNYLGYTWVDQGVHLERAQEMIRKAVKLRPNDGFIVDSLGWVLYRLGDFKGATKHLERAVVLTPEDPTINDHLGDAYWRVGRMNEAMFQWRRALSLDPEPELIPAIRNKIRVGITADPTEGKDG